MKDHNYSQNNNTNLLESSLSLPLWLQLCILALFLGLSYVAIQLSFPHIKDKYFPYIQSKWQAFKNLFNRNHHFISLQKKYPRISTFMHARFETSHFSGLSLTLFSILILYIIALFGGLVEDLYTHDSIVQLDHAIARWASSIRTDFFNSFFWAVTQIGRVWIVGFFMLFFSLFLWFSYRRYYLLGLYISVIGAEILAFGGKYLFARARPSSTIHQESFYSFPSAHATIAVAFFGFVLYTFFRENSNFSTKLKIFFISLVFIFLMGFSRIYLGAHYLSDIWGGYLIGSIWLLIGISLSEYQKGHMSYKRLGLRKSRKLSRVLGILALLVYLIFIYFHPFIPES